MSQQTDTTIVPRAGLQETSPQICDLGHNLQRAQSTSRIPLSHPCVSQVSEGRDSALALQLNTKKWNGDLTLNSLLLGLNLIFPATPVLSHWNMDMHVPGHTHAVFSCRLSLLSKSSSVGAVEKKKRRSHYAWRAGVEIEIRRGKS